MFGIGFTREQWLIIIYFSIANFCCALIYSVLPPFYPQEAEKKGLKANQYGLLFGIGQITAFLVSPVIGANLNRIGDKVTISLRILQVEELI